MASATLTGLLSRYPAGTTLSVYLRPGGALIPDGRAPSGNSITSASVTTSGTATFTGLAPSQSYVAYALVSSTHRYTTFSSDAAEVFSVDADGVFSNGEDGVQLRSRSALNVKDYGAVGDGSTDDTAAREAALAALVAAGGGILFFPAGHYSFSEPWDEIPGDVVVLIVGEGATATRLDFADDTASVDCAVKFAEGPSWGTGIRDVWISGPNLTQAMDGYPAENLDGLRIGGGAFAEGVRVSGFRAGRQIKYDHEKAVRCRFQNNRYGILYVETVTGGDNIARDCELDGNTYASIAVEGTGPLGAGNENIISGDTYDRCHLGYSPYVLVKLTPVGRALCSIMMFRKCAFESWGNAIVEGNGGAMNGVVFDDCMQSGPFEPMRSIVADGYHAAFHDVSITRGEFRSASYTLLSVAGDEGVFSGGSLASCALGDLTWVASATAARPILNGAVAGRVTGTYNGAECLLFNVYSSDVVKGDLVKIAPNDSTYVTKWTSGSVAAGAVLHDATNAKTAVVAVAGPAEYLVHTGNAISQGAFVKPDTANAGKVVAASSATDGPPVGYALVATSGGELVSSYVRGVV